MFMHIYIEDLILQPPIGTQRAHHISDRFVAPLSTSLNDADDICGAPGYSLVLVISHSTTTTAKITLPFHSARLRPTASSLCTFTPNPTTFRKKLLHTYSRGAFLHWSLIAISTLLIITRGSFHYQHHLHNWKSGKSSGICTRILIAILLLAALLLLPPLLCDKTCGIYLESQETNKCAASDSVPFFGVNFVDKFTVRALYAGTLVVDRTTAPRHQAPRRNYFQCQPYRAILLAALFIVLATLTIAARCYVSTNATGSIVQLSPTPHVHIVRPTTKTYNSPIHPGTATHLQYSTSQLQTSKIVLSSSFIKLRNENLQSDISVIDKTYSKLYSTTTTQNARIQESFYNIYKVLTNQASKRRTRRSTHSQLIRSTSQLDSKSIKSTSTAEVSNQISTFQDIHFDRLPDSYLNYRAKQDKNIPYPNHRFTVDIYKDNVYSTLPSVTVAQRPTTIPRYRSHAGKSASKPVILSIASVQKNSAINNRSSASVYGSTFVAGGHQNNFTIGDSSESSAAGAIENSDVSDHAQSLHPPEKRPMPPGHGYTKDLLGESSGVLVLVAACLVLTLALGLVTCVLNHYRGGSVADPPDVAQTPTTAPMLSVVSAGATAGVGGMDRLRGRGAARELAANRDHQVRLHTVHTDIAINLPPSISLPDGEEHPFSSRLHLRDTEQESEIYQKCIRPPPNRTVLESESPPPYRSSSAGLLGSIGGSSSGSSNDWTGGSAPLVVRCHSMSTSSVSSTKRPDTAGSSGQKTDFIQKTVKIFTGKKSQPLPVPTLPPVVIVPTRTRRTADQQHPHLNHNHHHHHQLQNVYHNSHQNHQTQQQQQNNSTLGRPNSNV